MLELQKENEKMEKQLEETHNQLVNQVEKTLYEKSQRTSREKKCLRCRQELII
jgi:hypothetical protein